MNDWDRRFAEPGYAYGEQPNDFLASIAEKISPGRVLSLGEGEGRNALFLAQRGFAVTTVDGSSVGLEKTRQRAAARGVKIDTVLADLAAYTIEPGVYGGIISVFCHLPAEVRRAVHRQVVAALRPGGVFVLEAYRPEQLAFRTGGPPVRELLVTLDDLRAELAGLRFEIAREVEREIHEGRLHNGRSAVVQVLAVKDT